MRTDLIVVLIEEGPQGNQKVEYHFPEPKEGPISPRVIKDSVGQDGQAKTVLPYLSSSQEQRAHYVFWSNGTSERINELVRNECAGVRSLLKYLIGMRIVVTEKETGFRYWLTFVSDRTMFEEYSKGGYLKGNPRIESVIGGKWTVRVRT